MDGGMGGEGTGQTNSACKCWNKGLYEFLLPFVCGKKSFYVFNFFSFSFSIYSLCSHQFSVSAGKFLLRDKKREKVQCQHDYEMTSLWVNDKNSIGLSLYGAWSISANNQWWCWHTARFQCWINWVKRTRWTHFKFPLGPLGHFES